MAKEIRLNCLYLELNTLLEQAAGTSVTPEERAIRATMENLKIALDKAGYSV